MTIFDAVDDLPMLHIFGEQNAAARLAGRTDDQGIPERDLIRPVQINGGENVGS